MFWKALGSSMNQYHIIKLVANTQLKVTKKSGSTHLFMQICTQFFVCLLINGSRDFNINQLWSQGDCSWKRKSYMMPCPPYSDACQRKVPMMFCFCRQPVHKKTRSNSRASVVQEKCSDSNMFCPSGVFNQRQILLHYGQEGSVGPLYTRGGTDYQYGWKFDVWP